MEKNIKPWEVWTADFPYEDNPNVSKSRPVIVLSVQPLSLLSLKVTKHEQRDSYDVLITKWKEAGLRHESVARTSKVMSLPVENLKYKIGIVSEVDQTSIFEKFTEYINSQKNSSKIPLTPHL